MISISYIYTYYLINEWEINVSFTLAGSVVCWLQELAVFRSLFINALVIRLLKKLPNW